MKSELRIKIYDLCFLRSVLTRRRHQGNSILQINKMCNTIDEYDRDRIIVSCNKETDLHAFQPW